jgi:hypothetical protein
MFCVQEKEKRVAPSRHTRVDVATARGDLALGHEDDLAVAFTPAHKSDADVVFHQRGFRSPGKPSSPFRLLAGSLALELALENRSA